MTTHLHEIPGLEPQPAKTKAAATGSTQNERFFMVFSSRCGWIASYSISQYVGNKSTSKECYSELNSTDFIFERSRVSPLAQSPGNPPVKRDSSPCSQKNPRRFGIDSTDGDFNMTRRALLRMAAVLLPVSKPPCTQGTTVIGQELLGRFKLSECLISQLNRLGGQLGCLL